MREGGSPNTRFGSYWGQQSLLSKDNIRPANMTNITVRALSLFVPDVWQELEAWEETIKASKVFLKSAEHFLELKGANLIPAVHQYSNSESF